MRAAGMALGMALFAVASTVAALSARPAAAASDPSTRRACTTPTVSTPAGRFCGLAVTVTDEGGAFAADAYEGIRYGNAKRWTPSTPVPASGLVKATAFGPICPQDLGDGTNQSEECLYLNLWTPTRSGAKSLPVMVFIHGGSFVSGAGSLPIYDGARLAVRGEVIVVTLNYRLGALGFLAGGSGADRLAGNYGFRDQQLALEWVSRNISGFGGDPTRITIFGESAGAMSVGAHLVAPGSRGLFSNALMESNPYGVPFKTRSGADKIRSEFDTMTVAAVCGGRLACLAKLRAGTIVRAQDEVVPLQAFAGELGSILAWAPYVDDRLIAGQPNQAQIARPLIAGTNRDEGTLFVGEAIPKGLSNAEYELLVADVFGLNARADPVRAALPAGRQGQSGAARQSRRRLFLQLRDPPCARQCQKRPLRLRVRSSAVLCRVAERAAGLPARRRTGSGPGLPHLRAALCLPQPDHVHLAAQAAPLHPGRAGPGRRDLGLLDRLRRGRRSECRRRRAPRLAALRRLGHPAGARPDDIADHGRGAQLPALGQDRL